MKIVIRKATERDFRITENITRETFWNLYKPGCDEHLVLNKLRKSNNYIAELDLVAVFEDEIIGHIISSRAKVLNGMLENEILCVGPLSVLPRFQKSGIGSMLMNESIQKAKELGYSGMILFGNPEYYHRFGFVNAEEYRITTKDYQNFEPFMALEIQDQGLTDVNGRFFEDKSFTTDETELIEFEKQFPYKEKLVTETQFKH